MREAAVDDDVSRETSAGGSGRRKVQSNQPGRRCPRFCSGHQHELAPRAPAPSPTPASLQMSFVQRIGRRCKVTVPRAGEHQGPLARDEPRQESRVERDRELSARAPREESPFTDAGTDARRPCKPVRFARVHRSRRAHCLIPPSTFHVKHRHSGSVPARIDRAASTLRPAVHGLRTHTDGLYERMNPVRRSPWLTRATARPV